MWFCSSLVWTVAANSPFAVSPSLSELAPLKSTSFRVTYGPKQLNTLHGAQLECFAYYKVILFNVQKAIVPIIERNNFLCFCFDFAVPLWMLQDGTDQGEPLLCPPWCMTVRVIGHCFQPGKVHFMPHCSLKPSQVVRHKYNHNYQFAYLISSDTKVKVPRTTLTITNKSPP